MPLLGPVLLALILAPALKAAPGGLHSGIDYEAFVAIGAVGLLVPLSCVFAGLSVLVDRHSGAQRELLAAPVPRGLPGARQPRRRAGPLGAAGRGADRPVRAARGAFHITPAGSHGSWPRTLLFTVFMYGVAETLASRVTKQEDYIGALPVVGGPAVLLRRRAVSDRRMPGALTTIAKFLPLTHALALMRYGFVDPTGEGLHDIWG